MKKILLTIACLGVAAGAFAQATITFANPALAGLIQTKTGTNAPVSAAPNTYTVSIYWVSTAGGAGAGVDPLSAGFDGTFILGKQYVDSSADFPVPGKFNGGNGTFAGLAGGASGFFEVIGWTGAFGSYSLAAQNSQSVGFSPIFANATGGAGSPPSTPASITGWNGGLLLTAAPEPTTIALGGLGAAALLLFRRRK